MEPLQEPGIWQTLVLLLQTLVTLFMQLAAFGFHWVLWLVFAAVCLGAINWRKARHMLAVGGWMPALLIIFLIALVWSRLVPATSWGLPNFWWQLIYVSMLAGFGMFCGWLQTVFHWTPRDINLDPPAHGHGHDHGHAHH